MNNFDTVNFITIFFSPNRRNHASYNFFKKIYIIILQKSKTIRFFFIFLLLHIYKKVGFSVGKKNLYLGVRTI